MHLSVEAGNAAAKGRNYPRTAPSHPWYVLPSLPRPVAHAGTPVPPAYEPGESAKDADDPTPSEVLAEQERQREHRRSGERRQQPDARAAHTLEDADMPPAPEH